MHTIPFSPLMPMLHSYWTSLYKLWQLFCALHFSNIPHLLSCAFVYFKSSIHSPNTQRRLWVPLLFTCYRKHLFCPCAVKMWPISFSRLQALFSDKDQSSKANCVKFTARHLSRSPLRELFKCWLIQINVPIRAKWNPRLVSDLSWQWQKAISLDTFNFILMFLIIICQLREGTVRSSQFKFISSFFLPITVVPDCGTAHGSPIGCCPTDLIPCSGRGHLCLLAL